MGDWLAGLGFNNAPRSARPAPPKVAGWVKGQTRVEALVACCPACGSRYLKIKTSKQKDVVFLLCRECGHTWKDTRADRLA